MPWGSVFVLAVLALCLYMAAMAAWLAVFGSGLVFGATAVLAVRTIRIHH